MRGIGIVLFFWLVARGAAQPEDPLAGHESADPVDLCRLVDRLGDDAVLSALDPERPVGSRLVAIRAAPALHAPERALEPLAALASGRDPDLAPAAAAAALAIARRLEPRALDAREVAPGELGPARAALRAVADDESARPDLRLVVALAVDALAALGVPAP